MGDSRERLYTVVPRDWNRMVPAEMVGNHWMVLTWLVGLVNPRTGTCYTNAARLQSDLVSITTRTVNAILSHLRDLCLIWYPGEKSGLKRYLVMVEGYQRSDKSRLTVYKPDGKLTAGARVLYKKMTRRDALLDSAPRLTVSRSVPLEAPDRRDDRVTVTSEETASDGTQAEGSAKGSRKGESGSQRGKSALPSPDLGRVPVGDDVGENGKLLKESYLLSPKDPPVVPQGTPHKQPGSLLSLPPQKQGGELAVLELAMFFSDRLLELGLLNKHKVFSKPELEIASGLLDEHSTETLHAAINAALADEYWRRGCHTFRSLQKNWSYISALGPGGANGSSEKPRRNHRAPQAPLPGPGDYSSQRPTGWGKGKSAGGS